MKTVTKTLKDKDGKELCKVDVQLAETMKDVRELAGNDDTKIVALFNRSHAQDVMNAARPGRGSGLGPYGLFFKKLSPEVQAKVQAKAEELNVPMRDVLDKLFASMI